MPAPHQGTLVQVPSHYAHNLAPYNMPGKAANGGCNTRVPATHVGNLDEYLAAGFSLAQS